MTPDKLDLTQPIQPRSLTGIQLDNQGEPVVQMQILSRLPFRFLLEKADAATLKQISKICDELLEKKGVFGR